MRGMPVLCAHMTTTSDDDQLTLTRSLEPVIRQHGALRVLGALLLRSLRRKPVRASLALNPHLRRDIGLLPVPPELPVRRPW